VAGPDFRHPLVIGITCLKIIITLAILLLFGLLFFSLFLQFLISFKMLSSPGIGNILLLGAPFDCIFLHNVCLVACNLYLIDLVTLLFSF
jgi:hypothetical protein